MSTLIFSPVTMNSGTDDGGAGLDGGGLGAAGGAVALEAGLGVGDLELDRRRQLDVEHAAVVGGDDRLLVLEHEVLHVADDLRRDLELLVGAGVHEDVGGAVVVEVLHRPLVDVGHLDLDVGVEGLVDGLARLDVLQLRAHDRPALAGLVVLEPDDLPELAVEVEHHAVLQVVRRSHASARAFTCREMRGALALRLGAGRGQPPSLAGIRSLANSPSGGFWSLVRRRPGSSGWQEYADRAVLVGRSTPSGQFWLRRTTPTGHSMYAVRPMPIEPGRARYGQPESPGQRTYGQPKVPGRRATC